VTVRQTVLPNGLTIVTDFMDTVETVSLGVWVRVGSRYEPAAINGVSHMLEHMAFKGTHRRSARQIAEEIESVGGHLNAFTSSEVTAYHATVMKEDVALAVNIIADILQNSVFDEEELVRERSVILQEIGHAQDSPEDLVFEAFQETAYPGQPLGRSILGPPEIVASMRRESLIAYMSEHYGAARMVVAGAGKLDHEEFATLCGDALGGLPAGSIAGPEMAQYRGGFAHLERDFEQLHLVVGYAGPGARDDWRYAAGVASMVLGGGMSSRLFQEVRENLGLAYSIYSFTSLYEDAGIVGVYAGTGVEQAALLLERLREELEKSVSDISEEELRRAKAQLRAGVLMSLESTSSRAERLARDIAVYGKPVPYETIIRAIASVSRDDVCDSLRRILGTEATVAAVGPRHEKFDLKTLTASFSTAV